MKTVTEIFILLFGFGCIIFIANMDSRPVSQRTGPLKERFHYRITGIGTAVTGGAETFVTEEYGEVRDGGYHPGCITFKEYNTGEQIRLCGSYAVRKIKGDPK